MYVNFSWDYNTPGGIEDPNGMTTISQPVVLNAVITIKPDADGSLYFGNIIVLGTVVYTVSCGDRAAVRRSLLEFLKAQMNEWLTGDSR